MLSFPVFSSGLEHVSAKIDFGSEKCKIQLQTGKVEKQTFLGKVTRGNENQALSTAFAMFEGQPSLVD